MSLCIILHYGLCNLKREECSVCIVCDMQIPLTCMYMCTCHDVIPYILRVHMCSSQSIVTNRCTIELVREFIFVP